MKLDKIKFAKLIGNIERQHAISFTENEIEDIDDLIDISIPIPPVRTLVDCQLVDDLLLHLNRPDGFISAIKAYRVLTNAGLKEAKQAIERYRNYTKPMHEVKEQTLADILESAIESKSNA